MQDGNQELQRIESRPDIDEEEGCHPSSISDFQADADDDDDYYQESDIGLKDNEPLYFVEKILDRKMLQKGGARYKVKWVGWPESQCTWEPLKNLQNVQELVNEFEEARAARQIERSKAQSFKNHYSKQQRKLSENGERVLIDLTEEKLPLDEDGRPKEDLQRKKNCLPEEGHLKYKDKPNKILLSKIDKEDHKLLFLVDWALREDGTKPAASYMSNEDFKTHNPVFLLEYYESKLVYFTKKSDSNDNDVTVITPSNSNDRIKKMAFELRSSLATEALVENLELEKKSPIRIIE